MALFTVANHAKLSPMEVLEWDYPLFVDYIEFINLLHVEESRSNRA